jgi:hypothetical protein
MRLDTFARSELSRARSRRRHAPALGFEAGVHETRSAWRRRRRALLEAWAFAGCTLGWRGAALAVQFLSRRRRTAQPCYLVGQSVLTRLRTAGRHGARHCWQSGALRALLYSRPGRRRRAVSPDTQPQAVPLPSDVPATLPHKARCTRHGTDWSIEMSQRAARRVFHPTPDTVGHRHTRARAQARALAHHRLT